MCWPATVALTIRPLPAAPGSVRPPVYRHSANASFSLNLEQLSQQEAEMACNDVCGHLAAYRSAQEQAATEQFYITQVGAGAGKGSPARQPWKLSSSCPTIPPASHT